ncbi:MAG: CDP-diacylglycerol--serine O-phosphatidyltransferase [Lentimicrobiaceae bacterium]|nr:CDP-diacylglycerol--serine O-phosphatidyltransferase [Lentimicrobiaceae bacterium]
MIKHIPNAITCCNLLSGCISIVLLCNGYVTAAGIMIFVAAIFDFFDGFAARLLKAYSAIGAELDSLSDVVSFGVAPSFIIYHYLQSTQVSVSISSFNVIPFVAFLLAVFAELRLAKFNVDDRQTTSFIGLPTPAMGLFVASLPFTLQNENLAFMGGLMTNIYFLLSVVAIFSYLMVSEIPFFSLKIKNLRFKENIHIYVLAAFAVISFIILGFAAIPFVMLFYIIEAICLNLRA